jgi:hypothetical protein
MAIVIAAIIIARWAYNRHQEEELWKNYNARSVNRDRYSAQIPETTKSTKESKNFWSDSSFHESPQAKDRQSRALNNKFELISINEQSCLLRGSRSTPYTVSLYSCTCPDFDQHHLPCKHMYWFADRRGVFNLRKLPTPLKHSLHPLKYIVNGVNPASGRKKTVSVEVLSGTPNDIIEEKSGLLPPYVIDAAEFDNPTEGQLEYAKNIGLIIPNGCNSADVSCLLSRAEDNDDSPYVSESLLRYASLHNIFFSPYIGLYFGYRTIYERLSENEKLKFFSYLVYCSMFNETVENLNEHSQSMIFTDFADQYEELPNILAVIDSISFDDLMHKKINKRNEGVAELCDLAVSHINLLSNSKGESVIMDFWSPSNSALHKEQDQLNRQKYAIKLNEALNDIDQEKQCCEIKGSGKDSYHVTLETCTCVDFKRRGLPCKHMYKLAHHLGVFTLSNEANPKSSNKSTGATIRIPGNNWKCPKCRRINSFYVGTCACGYDAISSK